MSYNCLMQSFLDNRGYTDQFLQDIMSCTHTLPKDTDTLCRRLKQYHDNGYEIVILSDVDVDGISVSIILFSGLSELGFKVYLYRPSTESYGFGASDIDVIRQNYPNARGVITGDVGITAYEGVQRAHELGLEIFVTDHHKCEQPLAADVVVDPQRIDDNTAFKGICGANVVYQVLRYYAEKYSEEPGKMISQIDRLRVFAGLGTISDGMPLHHENRQLVMDAIAICKLIYPDMVNGFTNVNRISGCDVYRRAFLGLAVVLEAFTDAGKLRSADDITEDFLGFYLAPAFNSVKRMCQKIDIVYMVFFGGMDAARANIATVLDLTDERKNLVKKHMEQLFSQESSTTPYIYFTDAPGGIKGLLAQRLMSASGMPTMVVSEESPGIYKGSGRCPSWLKFWTDTKDYQAAHQDHLYWDAAGHDPAFGITIYGDDGIDKLMMFIRDRVRNNRPSDEDLKFKPDYIVSDQGDGVCDFDLDIMKDFMFELCALRPFGKEFEYPVGEFKARTEDCKFQLLGKDKNHLKITMPHGIPMICFNQGEGLPTDEDALRACFAPVIDAVGKITWNDYRGVRTLQLQTTLSDDSFVTSGSYGNAADDKEEGFDE